MNPELRVAVEAVKEAAKLQLRYQESSSRISKGGRDFATKADLDSQEVIIRMLTTAFPDIAVVAEEGDPTISDKTFWLIDPIDGTVDYANRGESWGPIIGLVRDGRPSCGVIYQPVRDVLVIVLRGGGCYRNDERVSLGYTNPFGEAVIGTEVGWWCNDSYFRDFLEPLSGCCQGVKSTLSAAGSTVALLEGKMGAYVNLSTPGKGAKLWDFVIGALAMEELGGVACDPKGNPLTWDKIPMSAILASRQDIADELVNLTRNWTY